MSSTRLADILKAEIESAGPMPVSAFMARALMDPEHGYYTTGTPFGADGDFITAPEISQLFGEVVGAWLVHVAEAIAASAPRAPVALVELGPGRGTLMADILRVARLRPDLDARLQVHLVETSGKLRREQAATIAAARTDRPAPQWHDSLDTIPEMPMVLVANEFFDALPVEQLVMGANGWRRRVVGVENGELAFLAGEPARVGAQAGELADAPEGAILETCPAGRDIAARIGARLTRNPGAALIVDYGYGAPAIGDTLQALRRHRPCGVLEHVGAADLTAHVCFGALGAAAIAQGAQAFGPMTQAQFLTDLGIGQRAKALMQAEPGRRAQIEQAATRLISPDAMGALFKVMAMVSPGPAAPPPFAG